MKKRLLSLFITISLVVVFAVPSFGDAEVGDQWKGDAFLVLTNSSGTPLQGSSGYMNDFMIDGYIYFKTTVNIEADEGVDGTEILEVTDNTESSFDNIESFEVGRVGGPWSNAYDNIVNTNKIFNNKLSIIRLYRIKPKGDINLTIKYKVNTPAGVKDYESYERHIVINDGDAESWQVKPNNDNQYDLKDFGEGEYPTKTGKVFAGWYSDKACETPYTLSTGAAYAKFVDEKVLDLKWQWKSDKTALRFVSTIDSLNYQKVGFVFTGTYGTKTIEQKDKESTTVYEHLNAGSGAVIASTAFDNTDSKYFFTYTIRNMDASTHSTWTVTPYYVTLDGTKVMGTTKNIDSDTQQ